jgi:hypothetical protein
MLGNHKLKHQKDLLLEKTVTRKLGKLDGFVTSKVSNYKHL